MSFTIGFVSQNGVVLAADSRMTTIGTHELRSDEINKLKIFSPTVAVIMGGGSDFAHIAIEATEQAFSTSAELISNATQIASTLYEICAHMFKRNFNIWNAAPPGFIVGGLDSEGKICLISVGGKDKNGQPAPPNRVELSSPSNIKVRYHSPLDMEDSEIIDAIRALDQYDWTTLPNQIQVNALFDLIAQRSQLVGGKTHYWRYEKDLCTQDRGISE